MLVQIVYGEPTSFIKKKILLNKYIKHIFKIDELGPCFYNRFNYYMYAKLNNNLFKH